MLVHRSALAVCGEVAAHADEQKNPVLRCVHVRADGIIEATDGAILVQVKNAVQPPEEYPPIEGLAIGAPGPMLVPQASIPQALKFIPRKTFIPILQCVALIPRGDMITLAVHNLEGVQRVDIKAPTGLTFPDVDRVVGNVVAPTITVTLSVDVLQTLVRALTAARVKNVKVGIVDAATPLRLEAAAGDITITGLLAPMETR